MALLPICTRFVSVAGLASYRHFCTAVCGFCTAAAIAGRVAESQRYSLVDVALRLFIFLESFHHVVGVEQYVARSSGYAGTQYALHDHSLDAIPVQPKKAGGPCCLPVCNFLVNL